MALLISDSNPIYRKLMNVISTFDFYVLVRALREDGTHCQAGEVGRLVAKLPLPPGFASTLWQSDERFKTTYFESYPVSNCE